MDYILLAFTEKEPVRPSDLLFKDNLIGGRPFFSPELSQDLVDNSLNSHRLTCEGCHSIVSFIAQINCAVDDNNDRVIHIFACVNKPCPSKKWLVTRTLSPFVECQVETEPTVGTDEDWLSDEDDWEGAEVAGAAGESGSLTSKPQKLQERAFGPSITLSTEEVDTFQAFYLLVEEEEFLLESDRKSNAALKGKQVDINTLPNQDVGPVSDAYEKFLIPGTDKVSNKFIKKIAKYPDQVIRYNLGGQPLLNQTIEVCPLKCEACGSQRRFELQLTPGLISALTLNQGNPKRDMSVELDFGTVLIFTCEKDCGSGTLVIEEAVLLGDPDDELLKEKVEGAK